MADTLEEGWRGDLASLGQVHDLDTVDGAHAVAVDFPHEVLDSYRTDWGRGCFDDSFREQLPVMVWNHNPELLIGAGVRAENLGDRSRVVGRFADFDAVPQARAAHSMIEDRIVPGWSFHFRDGQTIAHPSIRGARRFVKARMLEFSPVAFPTIPGAQTAGVRSQEATHVDTPTLEQILELGRLGHIDSDGMRSLIAEHYPTLREHIRVATPTPAAVLAEVVAEHGWRDMVIRIGSDGAVSTGADETSGADGDNDPSTLAAATDAALDEACRLLDGVDVTALPDPVQQAIALVRAAGVAVDELLDVMGVDDPDDPVEGGDGERAVVEGKARDELPDSDFAYIEPGGTKDTSGRTVPRSKRHFEIQDAAHVRAALARIAQGAEFSKEALPAVEAAAKKFGVDIDHKGKRSEDDDALDADLDRALDKLGLAS